MLKNRGEFAVNQNALSRSADGQTEDTRHEEQREQLAAPTDSAPVVFSIADNRVGPSPKIAPESGFCNPGSTQLNPDERSIAKKAFDGISKFGTRPRGVSRRTQLLKHPFTSKIVHERRCLNAETGRAVPREYRLTEIWSRKPVAPAHLDPTGLRKQQSPGGETIDPMPTNVVVSSA